MRESSLLIAFKYDINGLVQERRNSIANTLELRLSCTNPSICGEANYQIEANAT